MTRNHTKTYFIRIIVYNGRLNMLVVSKLRVEAGYDLFQISNFCYVSDHNGLSKGSRLQG